MALADSYPRPPFRQNAPSAPAVTGNPRPAVSTLPSRMGNRPQNTAMQYQRSQIETASPTRLIILLYEGAIRFCQVALEAMSKGDLATQHTSLLRAQRIVAELLGSLNREKGGDVAANLARLYTHMLEQLVLANLHDQTAPVQTVQSMLRDLRASWIEVEQLTNGEEGMEKAGIEKERSEKQETKNEANTSAVRLSRPASLNASPARLGDCNA